MPTTSRVTVLLPGVLRVATGGRTQLELEAHDVRSLLQAIEREFPLLHRNLCDETGALRRHLNVFVNSDNTRDLEGVATAIAPGDVVTFLPAVSGG